jgi:hypothetical protein
VQRIEATEGEAVPCSAFRLIAATFALYRRFPWLFLTLAAAVIVPYEVLVRILTGGDPASFGVESSLTLADWVLVTPLVSALHVQAVTDVRRGETPVLGSVFRRGLQALPVVALASLISGVGIAVGFFLLLIPGIYLWLRWYVVAQAAAIERAGWSGALRSSHALARDNYWHLILFSICTGLIGVVPFVLIGFAFEWESTFASFLVGTVVSVVTLSFVALATALLYFDLRTRHELRAAERGEPPLSAATGSLESPRGDSIDPRDYSDETRPQGWYINPAAPHRMRYWARGERPGWALKATRTPRKVRRAWDARAASEKPPEAS